MTREPRPWAPSSLLAIAGLGSSGQSDVSERDEENLALELGRTLGASVSGDKWTFLHQDELMANWQRLGQDQPARKIPPLD